jgi:DNA-binding NarL/FixJ family response regulator
MKTLVIEDEPSIRRALLSFLRRMFPEAELHAVDSADGAIEQLRNALLDKPFDLIISDFNLVGPRTGGDVLEWIHIHATYLVDRFVFLTSDDRARRLHPRFLEKPCDPATLRAAIEATMQGPDGPEGH